ncbi:hypothetical protein JCM15765_15970 [Paradesulfitobacterium aromaticivorans]
MIDKIGLKYCGNCNPAINTGELAAKLKCEFPNKQFVRWDEDGIKVLIVLSGCARDCATRPPFTGPVIVVAGQTFNGWEVASNQLLNRIVACIAELDTKQRDGEDI